MLNAISRPDTRPEIHATGSTAAGCSAKSAPPTRAPDQPAGPARRRQSQATPAAASACRTTLVAWKAHGAPPPTTTSTASDTLTIGR